jgi:nitrate/TMAO reductase-like tetraheme cytochrome c subunit
LGAQATFKDWARVIYYLGQNTVSLIGVVLTTSSAITLIGFWLYDFLLPGPPHPYVGILLFLLLPVIFLLGLLLIPIGIYFRRRKLRAAGELPSVYPAIDAKTPMVRNGLLFVGLATLVNVLIFGFASYRGVAYMDTQNFCGQTCHTVMQPEFTAYQGEAHSHVQCVECHIGPGAGWFLRSKLSGLRQVYAVTFHTYSRPIPTPVKYLRPAKEICEECHWRGRYSADKLFLKTNYQDDEKNTPQTTVLSLKVGGVTPSGAVGIHGRHMEDGTSITYIATDETRQVIPVVYYTDAKGKATEFLSTETKASAAELSKGEKRTMDCIDCHNRPAHAFELSESAVDLRIKQGVIGTDLPFVRKKAVELLKVDYADRSTGEVRIREGLADFYRTGYPDIYNAKRDEVDKAADAVANIYLKNIFPEMKVSWGVHANNLGHTDFPGCFRCHDGSHTSAGGETIPNDCSTCHTVFAMQEENPKIPKDLAGQ